MPFTTHRLMQMFAWTRRPICPPQESARLELSAVIEDQGWYEFNVYADQTYVLLFGQWLAQGVARYTPLFRNGSEKIKADANEIGLLCQGNTITPFINGVQMRSWQDNKFGLKTGKIGISAASFGSGPFTVAYDWLKVSQP